MNLTKEYRLLIKAIVLLIFATMANIGRSSRVAAAAPRDTGFSCAACFTQPGYCEGNEDQACEIACGSWAVGECRAYDPAEVTCETQLQVYDWVECA